METLLILAAQQIAAYGFNKGLDKIFENKESFSKRLYKVISESIDEYEKKFPKDDVNGKFAFYKSEILIEEFLKYRLFAHKGYELSINKIQIALEKNPNIIKPTREELEHFFEIFDVKVKNEDKLKELEMKTFHKEEIFNIYEKVEKILNLLETHFVEVVGLLEEEYKEVLNSCLSEIKKLKLTTALKRLEEVEIRIEKNQKHVSKNLISSLVYFKALCYESLGKSNEAYEFFIKAYNISDIQSQYIEKACISYYSLKNEKYLELKEQIEVTDEFNAICWAINALESDDIIDYITNKVPKNVLDKNNFKRLVFNNNLKLRKSHNLHLIDSLDVNKLSKEIPEMINYDNLHHWIFVLNITSIVYLSTCEIPFFGNLKKEENTIYFLDLSRILANSIINSELGETYYGIVFFFYWLESEIDCKPDTIDNLKKTYNKLKEPDSFKTMLIANSVQKRVSPETAIKIIEEFKGELDESLISLKTYCKLDDTLTDNSVLEYFKFIDKIDNLNIINVCSYLIPVIQKNIVSKEQLIEIINKIEFAKQIFKELIVLIIDSLSNSEIKIPVEQIDKIKDELLDEPRLYFFISLSYFKNKYFKECIEFLESYINEEEESRDLSLYINALDADKSSDQLKLLQLLKKWRENYSFFDYFLIIEIELRQILKDWKEIRIISKFGLSKLPNDERFFTYYIYSLFETNDKEELEKELPKIAKFSFNITQNALSVANVLIEYGFLDEAIEIIYQKAVNRSDSVARMKFFSLGINFPPKYFENFEKVDIGRFVKYEIDGELETIHITESNLSNDIVKNSLSKNISETFTIGNKLTRKLKSVKILRIMNKFSALNDDIFAEANSSFSNLPIESIKFETLDKDGIDKAFIDNFGAEEQESRKHKEQNFSDFYSYKISFSELVNFNFKGLYIDSYYYLTSAQSDGFLIRPLKYIDSKIEIKDKKLVIDFSSGLLLYELSEKFGLKYDKFYITDNLINLIDNLIYQAGQGQKTEMSITLYKDKVIPHFYSEDFHKNRINFLLKLKSWFRENSFAEIPKEKINVIRPLYNDGKLTPALEFLIDCVFLAQRKDYVLMSDDISYLKLLHFNNIISSEKFLIEKFPDKKNDILEYMLNKRYIGITINAEVLYSSYINQNKSDYNHIYNYALRNISLKDNFSPFNIFVAVEYLKKLALNASVSKEKYKYDATNFFISLISSFPNMNYGFTLQSRIAQKFKLIPDYLDLTFLALLDALRIYNSH
ncbi:MAG: hypothetical protein A2W99_16150 [Bacteroidetes bacterium GWF2_33_16]|nr:MAG: hypothetical protein A2X00_15495 [Bacteroidetes bacterium GWE2_32_14]OFY02434.1 MAG: hypothetical protein A2W99_16150 [Bacteroidetes bacterium GWF2_33_16]